MGAQSLLEILKVRTESILKSLDALFTCGNVHSNVHGIEINICILSVRSTHCLCPSIASFCSVHMVVIKGFAPKWLASVMVLVLRPMP